MSQTQLPFKLYVGCRRSTSGLEVPRCAECSSCAGSYLQTTLGPSAQAPRLAKFAPALLLYACTNQPIASNLSKAVSNNSLQAPSAGLFCGTRTLRGPSGSTPSGRHWTTSFAAEARMSRGGELELRASNAVRSHRVRSELASPVRSVLSARLCRRDLLISVKGCALALTTPHTLLPHGPHIAQS